MTLLSWRAAQRRDRADLQAFKCTIPSRRRVGGRKIKHDRPWELEVQAGIHSLTPPVGDASLLLGYDEVGLAAVVLLYFHHGYSTAKLAALALECRLRGRGGAYADEAISAALDEAGLCGHAAGHSEVTVIGLIHEGNRPSMEMCRRAGLRHIETENDGLQQWGITLVVPPAVLEGRDDLG